MSNIGDALRANRAASLQPRPMVSTGSPVGLTEGLRDRKAFRNACMIATARIMADPVQPRQTFAPEPLARLAESMKARGQLVPILVRWSKDEDRFMVIDGERRYRAAVQADLTEMACVVESEADPATLLEIQLVTNALREDVSPMEQAQAWRRLMESKGYTHAELAAKLGYDRSTITRTVGLTDLPPEIQEAVNAGEIRPQTGYELSRVADPVEQARLAEEAKAGRLRRDDLKGRSKGAAGNNKTKAKLVTSRTFKGESGLRIVAERAKGIDLSALLATMEQAVEQIRSELAQAG